MKEQRVDDMETDPEKYVDPLDEKSSEWATDPESCEQYLRRVHTIAHDFNNVLSAILANLELAKTGAKAGSTEFERLNRAEEGVIRGRELSRQLLSIGLDGKISLSAHLDDLVLSYKEISTGNAGTHTAPSLLAGAGPKKQRILLMDDEDAILSATSEMLRFLTYEVSTAKNGTLAVDMYKEALHAGTPFDVVILDITVPSGMGAKETLPVLKAIDPSVRTIISSGYSTDPMILNFSANGFDAAMVKPYGFKELNEALNKACGA